jgi:hypothetical protein
MSRGLGYHCVRFLLAVSLCASVRIYAHVPSLDVKYRVVVLCATTFNQQPADHGVHNRLASKRMGGFRDCHLAHTARLVLLVLRVCSASLLALLGKAG